MSFINVLLYERFFIFLWGPMNEFLRPFCLCDRQRPFFAGTDTEKFSFRNMVSDKWPATFGNLFAVRRQADKQFSFYRPIDLVFYGKNVELERWTRKWSIEVTFYGGRTAIPGRHHRSIEWQCTFSAPQVHRGVRIYHVGFVVEMSLSCIFSSWPWSIIFPMKAA